MRLFRIAPRPANVPAIDEASPKALARLGEEAGRVVALPETQAAFAAVAGA